MAAAPTVIGVAVAKLWLLLAAPPAPPEPLVATVEVEWLEEELLELLELPPVPVTAELPQPAPRPRIPTPVPTSATPRKCFALMKPSDVDVLRAPCVKPATRAELRSLHRQGGESYRLRARAARRAPPCG